MCQHDACFVSMPFFVYILKSESSGRFYIGHTDNVQRRIAQHNDPLYHGSKTTKRFAGPWSLVYSESFESRSDAMSRELQIKKWKSRKAIESLFQPAESRHCRD